MDRWQFTKGYAERSGMTVFALAKVGRVARECDCDEGGCEGWQMIHRDLDPLDFGDRFPVEITDEAGAVFYDAKKDRALRTGGL